MLSSGLGAWGGSPPQGDKPLDGDTMSEDNSEITFNGIILSVAGVTANHDLTRQQQDSYTITFLGVNGDDELTPDAFFQLVVDHKSPDLDDLLQVGRRFAIHLYPADKMTILGRVGEVSV